MKFFFPNTVNNLTDAFAAELCANTELVKHYFYFANEEEREGFIATLLKGKNLSRTSFNYYNCVSNLSTQFMHQLLMEQESIPNFFHFTNERALFKFIQVLSTLVKQVNSSRSIISMPMEDEMDYDDQVEEPSEKYG